MGAYAANRLRRPAGEHRRALGRLPAQGSGGLRLDGALAGRRATRRAPAHLTWLCIWQFRGLHGAGQAARGGGMGEKPFEVYAATEPARIASECEQHQGMHLFEDLVITEVVDENNKPVPPGIFGEKVLVTVLFS